MLVARALLALAIGLLVGLERGWPEREQPDHSWTAGIRTFGILGLLSGISAAVAERSVYPRLAASLIAFSAALIVYGFREAVHTNNFSVTGIVAGLCTFELGALAVAGDQRAAAAAGAALAGILASRDVLHGLVRRLTWIELRSALVLAVMTAVILPLVPNRAIDPVGGFNPWQIWLFTALTAGTSYLGYVA
jgi:uncharacterized membrane protein (DUF4010 family)